MWIYNAILTFYHKWTLPNYPEILPTTISNIHNLWDQIVLSQTGDWMSTWCVKNDVTCQYVLLSDEYDLWNRHTLSVFRSWSSRSWRPSRENCCRWSMILKWGSSTRRVCSRLKRRPQTTGAWSSRPVTFMESTRRVIMNATDAKFLVSSLQEVQDAGVRIRVVSEKISSD